MNKFEIINKGGKVAEILFYGYINYWGKNSSNNLSVQLRDLDKENDKIIIRMNSGGGSVVEAAAIYNTIKSLKAETEIIIEGIAASAASFILLAADKVQMGKASRIMIHKFSGGAFGNADDLRETAQMMDEWENDWVDIYAERMGLDVEEVKSTYFKRGTDTWIGAKKAKELNLIHEVIDGVVKEAPKNISKLSPENAEASYQSKILNTNSINMNKEQLAAIGLPENATQAQIDARLKELAATEKAAKEKAEKEAAKPSASTNNEDPEKEALQAKVDKMEKDGRDKMLQDAVDQGKIVAANKGHYEEVGAKMGNEHLANILNGLTPAAKPNNLINPQNRKESEASYESMEDLYKAGDEEVEKLKNENPELFASLWQKYYGEPYTESPGEK